MLLHLKSVPVSWPTGREFVARTDMKINAEMSGAYVFQQNMAKPSAVGFRKMWQFFYKLEEYEGYILTAYHEHSMVAAHVRRQVHNGKFPLMMRTADLSKCLATNVRSRPIPKSLPIL